MRLNFTVERHIYDRSTNIFNIVNQDAHLQIPNLNYDTRTLREIFIEVVRQVLGNRNIQHTNDSFIDDAESGVEKLNSFHCNCTVLDYLRRRGFNVQPNQLKFILTVFC